MITGENVICLAPSEWSDNPVSNMHLMARLAAHNRVLYVETIGTRMPGFRDAARVLRRLKRAWEGPQEIAASLTPSMLTIYSPMALPYYGSPLVASLNAKWVGRSIRQVAQRMGFDQPIVWTFSPRYFSIVESLNPKVLIYHIVDELSTYRGARNEAFLETESRLIERADLVLAAGRRLFEKKSGRNPHTYHMPNATDISLMRQTLDPGEIPSELSDAKHPIIGYVGTLANWVDYDLLFSLATAHPEWTLVLVGYVHALTPVAAIEKLRALPNVRFTGQQPFGRLPEYYRTFDVCIVPYVPNEHIYFSNPTKFFEYLATGRPIVSTDFPSARDFGELVRIGRDTGEFVRHVEEALNGGKEAGRAGRLAEASKHSWDARVEQISALISERMEDRRVRH
jgi:glycosyltransferase involved in cell wall biosynthesis